MIYQGIEIVCPACKGDLREEQGDGGFLLCLSCNRRFPVVLGIADLRVFSDPYIDEDADRAKGLRVGARLNELSFAELIDFYYSITPVVPSQHARQYKRGLMSGVARAEAALASWESSANGNGPAIANSILDVGCGTAPLLAAASRYETRVGVDIAFRWLVVAKKRLAEACLDVPLICACAEALPFPDGMFDRVIADSVLEHLRDQRQGLNEICRVMRPTGYLFISTPNKYSLGPDPHAGIWGGGLLPESWIAAFVRRQGGIPPKRRLLSAWSLSRIVEEAGLSSPQIELPSVPDGQRRYFGKGMRLLIDLYDLAKRLPVSRPILRRIGPLLHAVARKNPNPCSDVTQEGIDPDTYGLGFPDLSPLGAPAKLSLAVVMPCYNEEGCIRGVVEKWMSFLMGNVAPEGQGRLIVVNDGSRDRTGQILDELAEKHPELYVVHQENGGHGEAVVKGYRCALAQGAEYVFQVDSDDQFDPKDFSKLWEKRHLSDFVLGYRKLRYDAPIRLFISRVLRWLLSLLFLCQIKDSNIPFRLIRGEFLNKLLNQLPHEIPFAPNIFLAVMAQKSGQNVFNVAVSHRDRETGEVSIKKFTLLRVCLRTLRELAVLRLRLARNVEAIRRS